MPKHAGMGGNKRKKGKKVTSEVRELEFKGEMEEYGQVTKLLGDGRFECQCVDGVKRVAHVRGKMRKRVWIANGDVILVSLREFENDKCDVISKYNEDEVRKLKKEGEIPESIILPNEGDKVEGENDDIVFEDNDKEDDKKDDMIFKDDDDDDNEEIIRPHKEEKDEDDKDGEDDEEIKPKKKPKKDKKKKEKKEKNDKEEDKKGEVDVDNI